MIEKIEERCAPFLGALKIATSPFVSGGIILSLVEHNVLAQEILACPESSQYVVTQIIAQIGLDATKKLLDKTGLKYKLEPYLPK
jgi:hypothetical protein